MAETGYRWVELEIYDRAMEMIAHSDRLEHECVEDAMTKYLEIFVQRWATLSKKEIWNKLNEGLPYFPSLGTFYKHTKGLEKRKYIAEQFRYEQLPDMLCLIGVKDELIETNLYKAKQLKLDAEKLLHGR